MTASTDRTYNGWTNYETWVTKLWMDNDQGSYGYWQEETRVAWMDAEADASFTKRERAQINLSDSLKSAHEDNTPTVTGVYADLLNAALSEVNWHEIAGSLLDDAELEEVVEEAN